MEWDWEFVWQIMPTLLEGFKITLIATVIFMPLILAYTAWVYRIVAGKVAGHDLESNVNAY